MRFRRPVIRRWRGRGAGGAAALTAAALAAAPAMSHAATVITRTSVTVTGAGARATITRVPFRISIQDGRGRSALAELRNAARLPKPLLPSAYPPPLGAKPGPENDLYAPLSFLVGRESTTQWGGGPAFFLGNEQSGSLSGIQYSAQDVVSARAVHNGAALVVSTDDPTGRRLHVTVSAGPANTIRVLVAASPSTGVALISDSFASAAREQFHGFGGRHNAIDQHGNDFYSWIEEENSSGVSTSAAAGQPDYMFPNGSEAAYTAHALFVSSRPYGFLLDQPQFARWRMGSDRSDAWQVSTYASRLNYLVAPGDALHAIGALSAITGREPVAPSWATGQLIDRTISATTPQTRAEAATQVASDLASIAKYHLPVSGYQLDAWNLLDSAQQHRFVTELRRLHIHLLRYFRAFVAAPTGGWEPGGDYRYAIAHHLVVTNANGAPATLGSPYQNGTAALIDFTNPAAVRWWEGMVRQALDQGADGFMQDFGEQIGTDWHFHNGETGATMHNRFPILYDRATRLMIDQYERQHRGRKIFFFTRAGYTGDPGSAAYENGEFLGDNTTSWDHASGLASVIPDELNRGVGGAYGPTTDIGGYLDLLTPPTTKELLLRWAELAALTPFYRLHNSGETGTRMPWTFGPSTLRIYVAMVRLHAAAQPLILRLWRQADQTGIPVMRPLWLADPRDPRAVTQDEEWLLGPDVLVAPVVTAGAASRSVYFPAGCWRDPVTRVMVRGPRAARVSAPLPTLPYYFRCGTKPFAAAAATRR